MKCTRIAYENFRNISFADIRPDEAVNIFYGNNAEGKTNALEGIYLMAQGRSFRAAREREMIRFGESGAVIHIEYTDAHGKQVSEMRLYANGKRVCRKNGVPVSRLSAFIGSFRAVIFYPGYLSIVRDGPSERRSFLDMAISQLNPLYLAALQRYNRILGQRNALIRQAAFGADIGDTVSMWSEKLAQEAAYIAAERQKYVSRLEEQVKIIFSDMTGGREIPRVEYHDGHTEEEYRALLQNNLAREIKSGITLYGTHRDDVNLMLNDREARRYASQGQQRSLALAMKLSEGEISCAETGEYPVYLLDDVFSEIDAERRQYLLCGFGNRQIIITSCDAKPGIGTCFHVQNGSYQKETNPGNDAVP